MSPAPKASAKRAEPKANLPSEFAPGVCVGGWKDALRFEGSRFCVLDEAPGDMPKGAHFQIYDGDRDRAIPRNLDELARAMAKEHANGQRVLVFCGHGVRRSPLAAAWYLKRTEGLTLEEAYRRIRAVRPNIEEAREWIGNTGNLDTP